MKLERFTFHPHAIQVDGKPLHAVTIGTDGVTDIQLFDGALVVSRGAMVWFTHTSYGTGVPVRPEPTIDPRTIRDDVSKLDVLGVSGEPVLTQVLKKQRSKKQ